MSAPVTPSVRDEIVQTPTRSSVDQWNLNQILRVFPGTLMERSTYAPPPSNLTARRVTGREEPVPPEVSLSDNPLYGGPGKYQTAPRPKRKGSKAPRAKTRRRK